MVASDLNGKTIQVRLADCCRASSNRQLVFDLESLQRYVEQETGFLVVVKGMGQLAAAVAELKPPPAAELPVFGVVRLSQMMDGACFVDALIEFKEAATLSTPPERKRPPRAGSWRYSLAIHEFGDLSGDNYNCIGIPTVEIFEKQAHRERPTPISIQRVVPGCDVACQIGKSVALSLVAESDVGHDECVEVREILSAAVIARASTIESNKKQICSCSGKTIWQERQERQKES